MNVARNAVGRKAIGEHRSRGFEGERSHAVADVEDHAAPARFDHCFSHTAIDGCRVVGEGAEAMGKNVSLPQSRQHIFKRRGRKIDMHHHWQADLLSRLSGDVERDEAGEL